MSDHVKPALKKPARQKPAAKPAVDGVLSEAEFQQWLAADPANQERFDKVIEAMLAGHYGAVPPAMLAAAQQVLAKKQEHQCMQAVSGKIKALMEVLERPPGTTLAAERIQQCQALANEITDVLLDMPEPQRTEFLKRFVPMWEKLRALR